MVFLRVSLRCSIELSLRGGFAGGGPAAAHFSCLAKKSKQKKATAKPLPFGVPGKVNGRTGNETNSPLLCKGSDMFRFLSVLPPTFPAASTAGKAKAKPLHIAAFDFVQPIEYLKVNGAQIEESNRLRATSLHKVAPQVFAVPAVDAAEAKASKADKKRNMSESLHSKGELVSFPALGVLASGTRRAAALRSPSFAYFSWRDKKSERLPGRPRRVTTE